VLDDMVSVTASKYLLARGRVWESDSSQPCEAAGQKAGTATQLTVVRRNGMTVRRSSSV